MTPCGVVFIALSNVDRRQRIHWSQLTLSLPPNPVEWLQILYTLVNPFVSSVLLTHQVNIDRCG
jgi:hypothetical protein